MQRDNKWSWNSGMISLVPYCPCSSCCFKAIIFTIILSRRKAITFPLLLLWRLFSVLYPEVYLASDSSDFVSCHCPLGSTHFFQDLDPLSSPLGCLAYLFLFCVTLALRETRRPPPLSSFWRHSSVSCFLMVSVLILCRYFIASFLSLFQKQPFFALFIFESGYQHPPRFLT